ncbi:MAG TPA: amylo-alpha-1,6-glucosidase [Steroidobacteraceae bacterium]|jgi:glycogen debranching enzyme|nr:amylo-alpha-1,6-glucosidase [Steroidobacteraceae bacterium]
MAHEPGNDRGLARFTLKDGNTFLLANALGDIEAPDSGLFWDDTRMLSRLQLQVADSRPSLLGAAISQDNVLFTAQLTNRPLPAPGEHSIPQGVIHLERTRFLWSGQLYERLKVTNFSSRDAQLPLAVRFGADFADIFEVQGHVRERRGERVAPEIGVAAVRLAYRGLDRMRTVEIRFSVAPLSLSGEEAQLCIGVQRGRTAELFLEIGAETAARPTAQRFEEALHAACASMQARTKVGANIDTSGRLFDQWLARSRSDLALLTTELPTGPYPYAGIPWFATPFGRDAIITALQTLWLDPQLAAGVLRFLASTQAHEVNAFRDSAPGKIMHEMRRGEMAALQEVPFGQYYGGVDTTPLFIMLAGAYESTTGDAALIDQLWPNLLAATAWIEHRMAHSGSGFIDYARATSTGLVNQAWKDSSDSIFHADGRIPPPPIAVVEVQGYAYAAFRVMSRLAALREDKERSLAWAARARGLRTEIERRFWVPELNFYALAIDGEGQPCCVHASNAGHLLYCGVPSPERGTLVAKALLGERFASGWGIRTLAEGEARYNPMSYHNGTVWPHDTALCAAGIARYLGRGDVVDVLSQLFEAATQFTMRLPELYCGFARTPGQGPTPYPVACVPQAWSCGSVFMLLQACLGLQIDGPRREVRIEQPLLPNGIEAIHLTDIAVGDARIDLNFERVQQQVIVASARDTRSGVQVYVHL